MTAGKIFALLANLVFITSLTLIVVYYLGEFQAFWRRFKSKLDWAAWKKHHLQHPRRK